MDNLVRFPRKHVLPVLGGLVFALLLIFVAVGIDTFMIRPTDVVGGGATVLIVMTLSLGLTFGYYLGLSLRKSEDDLEALLFYSSFFGTFAVSLIILLLLKASLIFVGILVLSVLGNAILASTIESPRLKYLRHAMGVFSEKVSRPIFGTYAGVWYLNAFVSIEISVALTVVIIIAIGGAYAFIKRRSLPRRQTKV